MSKNPHSLVPKFNDRTCQTLLSTPPLGTCDNLKCGKSATWELLFIVLGISIQKLEENIPNN